MTEQELREKIVDTLNATEISVELKKEDIYKFADALIANKFGRIINFAEYVGSKIAGHSNYHGDSILCALYCAAEGKEIHNVKPLDITEYGYNVLVKERDEYKHRAEVTEMALKDCIDYYSYSGLCPVLNCNYNKACWRKECTPDIEKCFMIQAEKELAEERKEL